MSRGAKGIIDVVEAAYRLDAGPTWLEGVLDAARPLLDGGRGVLAFEYLAPAGEGMRLTRVVGRGVSEDLLAATYGLHTDVPPEVVDRTMRLRTGCATSSEITGMGARLGELPRWKGSVGPLGVADYLGLNAIVDPGGRGCNLGAPLDAITSTPPRVRQRWSRVAAHIAAGMRLRDELAGASPVAGADAVLTARGRLEHAGPATSASLRERLRRAALHIDRARGRLRHETPDEALELWQGLVAGRWSLVDHFERDGRRYLVARKNDPGVIDPRRLSLRERQVAWYAALGHANKLIAYELGLAVSTVSLHLANAAAKLGARSRPEVIALVRALASSPKSPT